MSATLIYNLSQIATPIGDRAVRGRAMREIRVIDGGAIAIENGRLAFVGPEAERPRLNFDVKIDAHGGTAIPGFVDTHTHLPFAGARESEFNRRLHGEKYEAIAASGGGILSTVRATRAASEDGLVALMRPRLDRMALHGTTTAEAKSGYGLDLEHEVKQLRAISRVSSISPVELIPTCLAAHDIPEEHRSDPDEYVREIIEEILPIVSRERLARFVDAFVERGAYSLEQGERVLAAGKSMGLTPRLHADEFSDGGGAAMAARIGAASADHLMFISESGIAALAASQTIANLLPATSFFLMSDRYAPARKLLDAGAAVSLSTDCNPGSSMTESMPMVIQLACLQMRMTVEEALTAATLNGASSLGLAADRGSLETGKRADVVVLGAPNFLHLVYHFGVNLVSDVFRGGAHVVRAGRLQT